MRFESMLAFWRMKDMVKHSSCLTRDKMYDSEVSHVVYSCIVSNGHQHAHIIYRYEEKAGVKSKFAFTYGDILFSGFPDITGPGCQVFIKDAKLADIRREFVAH